jgi:hypothetical protein
MSATARAIPMAWLVPNLEGLTTRTRTARYLFRYGYLDLISAVDQLQGYAERTGLVREIVQDAVQAIIAAAFERVRREAV